MPTDMRDTVQDVESNLQRVRARIAGACAKVGRRPESVTLVAVTKNAAPEQVRAMIALGVSDFGENYVQALVQRAGQFGEFHSRRVAGGDASVAPQLRWHKIGHLQRNKARQALPHLAMLQTLDSLRLAEELEEVCGKMGMRLPCLLQLNASEEPQKSGVAVGAAYHLAEQVVTMPNLRLMGLMCMAREGASHEEAQRTFARCAEVFDEIRHAQIGGEDMRHLSMGMTQDLEAGIMEGATIVRVGSALFGSAGEEHPGAGE